MGAIFVAPVVFVISLVLAVGGIMLAQRGKTH
jgi:hypothetical protein